jgi:hypothetical protein
VAGLELSWAGIATPIDIRRLPPATLAALPDFYRAGLGIDDAADRLASPCLERMPARPLCEDPDDYQTS